MLTNEKFLGVLMQTIIKLLEIPINQIILQVQLKLMKHLYILM